MSLADVLEPGKGTTRLHFPEQDELLDYGRLWRDGARAMSRVRREQEGRPVAAALVNSVACTTVVVGSIAAGQPLVSVPMVPRAADAEWYRAFLRRVAADTGATTVLVDPAAAPALEGVDGLTVRTFDDVLASAGPAAALEPAAFTLTQFTSGSTSAPKGVVLPGTTIAANLRALTTWMDFRPGDGLTTWLPLSHDMGLIGTLLGPLAASAGVTAGGFDLALLSPRGFLKNPRSWLRTIAEVGSTHTIAPNFGYDIAARRGGGGDLDLSRLRMAVVGAEPIRPASMARFETAFAGTGLPATALTPAYGMAEMTLVFAGCAQDARWRSEEVTLPGRDDDRPVPAVSCGAPLPGFAVRTRDDGELLARGPSLAEVYSDGSAVADDDGWFATRDLGLVHEGELFVLGRTDDVFQVAGRNVYALDVEAHAGEVDGVRPGRVVAVPEEDSITLVAECEEAAGEDDRARAQLALRLREALVGRLGLAPHRVLLTARGAIPMTSSGKIQRRPLVAALAERRVEVLGGSIDRGGRRER